MISHFLLVGYVSTVNIFVTIVEEKVFRDHDVLIAQFVNGHRHINCN